MSATSSVTSAPNDALTPSELRGLALFLEFMMEYGVDGPATPDAIAEYNETGVLFLHHLISVGEERVALRLGFNRAEIELLRSSDIGALKIYARSENRPLFAPLPHFRECLAEIELSDVPREQRVSAVVRCVIDKSRYSAASSRFWPPVKMRA
jgi:hypothetical protein